MFGSLPTRRSSSATTMPPPTWSRSSTSGAYRPAPDPGSTHRLRLEQRPGSAMAGSCPSRRCLTSIAPGPILAARILRDPRAGPSRGGADARLRARRAGPQDVEVAGQRGGAAAGHEAARRRHPAPLGRRLGLFRRSQDRGGDPEASATAYRRLPTKTRCAIFGCPCTGFKRAEREICRSGECPTSSAGCCIASAEVGCDGARRDRFL